MLNPPKIRVLIVDDQPHVCKGLHALLETDDMLEVVGIAVNGIEAIDIARAKKPDIILMDATMPHLDGYEAARLIKNLLPSTHIILMHNEGDALIETDDLIFEAHILKSIPESDLIAKIYILISQTTENINRRGIS